ncbi:MAG: MFS transporter [Rhodanobacteraceae bacterium]
MTASNPALQESPPIRVPLRDVFAVFVGNGLEFYDFVTYGLFAVYLGRTFFPSEHPGASLLGSLTVFGAGFVTRPLGGLFFGPLADRIGRKPVMVITFSLMGLGMAGLCLTPSHARIGIAAPILVLVFRLIQGFALGGEVGPSTAYMVEAAPPLRRGFYGAMQALTQDASSTIAGVVALVLGLTLTDPQLTRWGWRVAMGLGIAIIPFGLWLRTRLPETMHVAEECVAQHVEGDSRTLRERLAPHRRVIVCGLLMLVGLTVGGYSASYMTTYALSSLHLPSAIAFGAMIVYGAVSMAVDASGGWLSDRFGRRPAMFVPMLLLLLLILPCYWAIDHYRTMAALYGGTAILSILAGLGGAPIFTLITEQVPTRMRSGTIAILYAFTIAIFGGTTQLAETWLIQRTGSPLAPAFYWIGSVVLSLIAIVLVKESAPIRLQQPAARRRDSVGEASRPAR